MLAALYKELHEVCAGERKFVMLRGEALDVLKDIPDGIADALICDPPYSSGGFTRGDRVSNTAIDKYRRGGTHADRPDFAGDNRDQRSYLYWCALWLSECLRICKPGSPICVFTDWRQLPITTDAVQAGGWVWRGIVPWDKSAPGQDGPGGGTRPVMGRFAAQAEYVVWGSAGAMEERKEVGCLAGVVREPVLQADKHHVTGKPTAVMQQLAKICVPGGVILDPFAGSGSTGVGALLEGRRFIGIEMGEDYQQIAHDRLEAAAQNVSLDAYRAGQVALFGGT